MYDKTLGQMVPHDPLTCIVLSECGKSLVKMQMIYCLFIHKAYTTTRKYVIPHMYVLISRWILNISRALDLALPSNLIRRI